MQQAGQVREQARYARLAGAAYLVNYAMAVFGAIGPPALRGSGGFAEQARRAVANERLYAAALASSGVAWLLVVVLGFALYVVLAPVDKRLAQLALLLQVAHACLGGITFVFSVLVFRVFTMDDATFGHARSDAVVRALNDASGAGFQLAMVFAGTSSALCFALFARARYLPRPLALLGVGASVLMTLASIGMLVLPRHAAALQPGWAPMGIAEVATALWLVTAGIRVGSTDQPAIAR